MQTNRQNERCRVAVLISGSGSNLQAIIDAVNSSVAANSSAATDPGYQICAVISNRPDVKGLERAAKADIDRVTLDHKLYPTREAFDEVLANTLDGYQPDLIVLAGFMRILSDGFVKQFKGKLINIHPSLLPKYPGLNTHQRALDAGDSHAGCTVHFVSEELDGGPAIIQAQTNITRCNNAAEIAQQVQVLEHKIYPIAIDWFANDRLKIDNNHSFLDNTQLPASGYVVS
ncbi:MAG: phosphoribosylglycinamide formyltransferase-1 [Chitinophagales bacterium]